MCWPHLARNCLTRFKNTNKLFFLLHHLHLLHLIIPVHHPLAATFDPFMQITGSIGAPRNAGTESTAPLLLLVYSFCGAGRREADELLGIVVYNELTGDERKQVYQSCLHPPEQLLRRV